MRVLSIGLILAFGLGPAAASAQTACEGLDKTKDKNEWLNQRRACVIARAIAQAADVGAAEKQVDTPAVAGSSTALVDRTAGPDLFGLAMQFFNVAKADGSEPVSVTVSAFALRTALQGKNPMRPEVYAAGRAWRRYSFTVGREPASDDGSVPESQIFGVKALLWDRRDLAHSANVELIRSGIAGSSARLSALYDQIDRFLFDHLGGRVGVPGTQPDMKTFFTTHLAPGTHATTLAKLTEDELAELDDLLATTLIPALDELSKTQDQILKQLARQPQFAVSYNAKLRRGEGDDEHAVQANFDYITKAVTLSANAAWVHVTRASLADEDDFKIAGEAIFKLTGRVSTLAALVRSKDSLTVSASFAATGHTGQESTQKGQLKLTVPIAKGVSLPISLTVANRPDLIDEKDIRGQVGFTVDFAKLTDALRSSLR